MGKLDGKVAVITGAASGIGEATARLFVEQGARVVIGDIQDDRGTCLADELGSSAAFHHVDVTHEPDVKASVDQALERFGRLDCMFNNAGVVGFDGPIEDTPADGFDFTISVLLRGVFLGMKHSAPVMKRQKSGSIISSSSVAGLIAGHSPHAYATAKAGIIQLTRSVALELGESGVRVNCICPGGIATPIFGTACGLSPEAADATVETVRSRMEKLQPIRRAGLPEDIALAALWLASDDSSFVNGHSLVVDGGISCGKMWSDYQQGVTELVSVLLPAA